MRNLILIVLIFVMAVSVCLALPIAKVIQPVKVVLRANAEVNPGTDIKLSDIADIFGSQQNVRTIESIRITTAPLAGQKRSVSVGLVKLALSSSGIDKQPIVSGADMVSVTGKSIKLSALDIAEEAKAYLTTLLSSDNVESEISINQNPREMILPFGAIIEMKPRLLSSSVQYGLNTITVDVFADSKLIGSTNVGLRVRAVKEVLVIKSAIKQGESVNADNTAWEKREVTGFNDAISREIFDDIGWIAKRSLMPGAIVSSSMLAMPIAVKRGEQISIKVICGSVQISTNGTADENGSIGDSIRIKTDFSKEPVRAKIVSAGNAEILR